MVPSGLRQEDMRFMCRRSDAEAKVEAKAKNIFVQISARIQLIRLLSGRSFPVV